jgi:hypothetical protein
MDSVEDRRRSRSPRHQFLALGPLLVVWAVTASLLYLSAAQNEVPTEQLFLDPASMSGQPWYSGLLHEVGILAWTVGATAAAGGAWISWLTGRPGSMRFLASGSALTLLLLGDEVIGFHAGIGPRFGISKLASVGALVVLAALWSVSNWREIRRTRWLALLASLVALAASIALDYERRGTNLNVFYEDAPKLLGIVGWATYFVFTTVDITLSAVRTRESVATV